MIILDRIKQKNGLLQILIMELIGSFLLGVLIANVTKATYSTNTQYIDTLVYLDLNSLDKLQLLIFVMQYRIKEYLLIWLFSITILAVPYNTFYILYKGFTAGFVIGALSALHGWKGTLCGISLGMPHYLVYIVVLIQAVQISYKVHDRNSSGMYTKRTKLFVRYLPAFLVLLSVTIIGCFMEAFLNPAVVYWIKKTLKLA